MLKWFLSINYLLRNISNKANIALVKLETGDEDSAKIINGYLNDEYQDLYKLWEEQSFPTVELDNLGRHINFGDKHDYHDILERDLPFIETHAEKHARETISENQQLGFEDLIHPEIYQHAFKHYISGHYREAVLNSIISVFDLIRKRTGLDLDGSKLVNEVFSLDKPRLILSDLESESGQNDQKGFLQILTGAYLGIRNPKAHSLANDLVKTEAAQYLIFASLLAKRVCEAKQP